MSDGPENKWLAPSNLIGMIGMLGAIGGAWMSFDSRITRVEERAQANSDRFDRIDAKLDRLIERLSDRGDK